MIKVENLHKSFGKNKVLNGIDLTFEKGKITTIIGQSGSGKSVFLKHLVGLFKPDMGRVYVDNQDITDIEEEKMKKIREKFSYLFQGGALFDSLNILENVAFPVVWGTKKNPEDYDIKEKVKEVLARVGLKNIEYKKPSELSGGMKKRVALARAIIKEPEYILYDEPTTGLDPVMSATIDDIILKLNRDLNILTIVVSHDMQSVYKISDTICMLYGGKIVFEGTESQIKKCKDKHVNNFINRMSINS
ncbi:MAG: ATP-binding cassette domain-containing protein [Candidatus Mcinerneyibacterium aminivorans]|uniref:ATP-binding cassette domain-containing protein n=1 Tax=Candidatus Mcinerneyibacterium aminivorans TaxID=2703815 RepID=A0A5D0MDC4_9BACT|nr:MAG: ATP-binding cassette domain-containing protein [Candidatus Mcinerneyibacterium aminivorans]